MQTELGFIVEGHGEYDCFPSIIAKIRGCHCSFPIANAKGIGNIIKNTDNELLYLIKHFAPSKIIICLDYREAEREKFVDNCVELKNLVKEKCDNFMISQKNSGLILPSEIIVIIANRTYDSWLCADYENLKNNALFDANLITEEFDNVDSQILNPCNWLESKLAKKIDMKSRAYRKRLSKTLRPEVAKEKSRSFRKFYKEVSNINVA